MKTQVHRSAFTIVCLPRRRRRWLVGSLGLVCVCAAQMAHAQELAVLTHSRADRSGQTAPDAEVVRAVPECQTDLRLSGALYNAAHPERSFATFHVQANHPGEVYRQGMRVGAFQLIRIEPRGVLLRGEHGGCWLRLLSSRAVPGRQRVASAAPPRAAIPRPAARGAAFSAEELTASIRPLGANSYEVKRGLVAQAVARMAKLSRSTRFRQVQQHSKVVGLQLMRVPADGLVARLGLKHGDLIKTLNGLPLTSLDGALKAEQLVTSVSRLSLLVLRGGQPIALDYRIVP